MMMKTYAKFEADPTRNVEVMGKVKVFVTDGQTDRAKTVCTPITLGCIKSLGTRMQ